MEQDFEKNNNAIHSGHVMQWTGPTEKIPMHPDDFNALLAWITAKRFHETGFGDNFTEMRAYSRIIG